MMKPDAGNASASPTPAITLRAGLGLLLLVIFAAGIAWWLLTTPASDEELFSQAREALAEQRPADALHAAEELLERQPESARALQLAGDAIIATGELERAAEYLERIPRDGSPAALTASLQTGKLLLSQLSSPSRAEPHFLHVLEHEPQNLDANRQMGYLLGLTGRYRDAIPYRLQLLRLGQVDPITLYLLCTGHTVLENVELLQKMFADSPDDPLLQLGMARHAIDAQDNPRAVELLQRVIAVRPELSTAHALLGGQLLETGAEEEFLRWHHRLPSSAEEHPEIWTVRGNWSRQHDQPQAALRCFLEAIRRDPNHERANWQLSQLLIAAGRPEDAEPFLARSRRLEELFDAVTQAAGGRDMEAVREASEIAERLGLTWEAYGWARLMLNHAPRTGWAADTVRRLEPRLDTLELHRTAATTDPAADIDLSDHPLPDIPPPRNDLASVPADHSRSVDRSDIRFVDEADGSGLRFQYFNGSPPGQQTRKMFEFNGGGAAVLDYDLDGWPDIYLTQGCRWPPESQPQPHSDRLFRNMGAGRFVDVTASAGLEDASFSAGATVGDYNSDGWPDLYVANIGPNRLLRNNGDGTFTDVTAETGTAGNDWSTSCVLADLNGDTLPDLYVVNYLSGEDLFERLCPDPAGVVRSCTPRDFRAAQDRLYVNLGDGTFRDATSNSGIRRPDGKGLGIVAADFFGTGRLDLFVANDAVPNFFFVNRETTEEGVPQFAEEAPLTGLALNSDGRSEACMGIAVADVNNDARLDLFVTNFHNESNTLYQQQPGELFTDATRAAGLHAPSLKMLGFGTQFLDADLDSMPDLIVTNGHIDDLSDTGVPYRMPTQFFRGLPGGRFEELRGDAVGEFFTGEYLGRGLARLDWNRDGLEDAVVSHLEAPVALLTNRTPTHGNWLALQLAGIESSRDAFGATVTIDVGGESRMRQLTAGDGFQCSNQRQLIFGLGPAAAVEKIEVRWPSGQTQTFGEHTANQHLLIVEGADSTLPLADTPQAESEQSPQ